VSQLLSLVVNGAVAGALYAVLAAGVVLTYQTSGVFNFGHAAIAYATAYVFFQLHAGSGLPVWVSAVLALLVFAPLLGWSLDRLVFRRLGGASDAAKIVGSVGLLIALPAACLFVVERLNSLAGLHLPSADLLLSLPGLGPSPAVTWTPFAGVVVSSDQLAALLSVVVTALLLWLVVQRSGLGLRMRAVVDRRELAALRGVDVGRTSSTAWILSSMLAGLAGILIAPIFTLAPSPYVTFVFIAVPAMVLGRLRSIPIALLGGLVLGVVQNLVAGYLPFADAIPGLITSVPFLILFLLLFFLGVDRTRRTGSSAEPAGPPDHLADLPGWRRAAPWVVASAALLVYTFVADDFRAGLVARGLAMAVVLLSFTLVTGVGGMVSLAQAAFVTAGGFAAGWAVAQGAPFLPALVLGTAVGGVLGLVVAVPTRRLGGLPLALATLALAYVGQYLLFPLRSLANGSDGWVIPPPTLGPLSFDDPRVAAITLLAVVLAVIGLIGNLRRSPSGRAMAAVRSSPDAAATVGINPVKARLVVFTVSAAIAGLGGVLLTSVTGRITSFDYSVELGLVWLAVTVTFGIRRPAAAVVAGLSVTAMPALLETITTSTLVPQMLFGLGAIGLAKSPDGILAAVGRSNQLRRLRRSGAVAELPGGTPVGVWPRTVDLDVPAARGPGLLDASDIRAGYGFVEVLHGVDISVRPGEVLALFGANGSGKSTLCALLAGVLPATGGRVLLDGEDVTSLSPDRRCRRGLFYVPESRGVFPGLTVEENLRLALADPAHRDAVYLRFPVLAQRRRVLAGSLSGGEQQMLGIGPALIRPPRLLIADEPSLGLAPRVVDQVYSALKELAESDTAVLLVEEKAREALALADSVAVLAAGTVVWTGLPSSLDAEDLVGMYLGASR
jgi:ABC-type branched-subunit amino acid transport system ATPase component/branched-subunit amino acid ABC-type transport system permease component